MSLLAFGHRKAVDSLSRMIELYGKPIWLLHPHAVEHMAGQRGIVDPIGFTLNNLAVILCFIPNGAVLKVDEHSGIVGIVESIAVEGDARCSREFGPHTGIGECHGVITRCRCLALFAE